MSAKEIREALRLAESRGKNLYVVRTAIVDPSPVRVIGARQHKGFTEIKNIHGRWMSYEFQHHSFYEA